MVQTSAELGTAWLVCLFSSERSKQVIRLLACSRGGSPSLFNNRLLHLYVARLNDLGRLKTVNVFKKTRNAESFFPSGLTDVLVEGIVLVMLKMWRCSETSFLLFKKQQSELFGKLKPSAGLFCKRDPRWVGTQERFLTRKARHAGHGKVFLPTSHLLIFARFLLLLFLPAHQPDANLRYSSNRLGCQLFMIKQNVFPRNDPCRSHIVLCFFFFACQWLFESVGATGKTHLLLWKTWCRRLFFSLDPPPKLWCPLHLPW